MLTRFQVMAIATAVDGYYRRMGVGDNLLGPLCDHIRTAAQELEYYHENPLDALKQTESHLVDAVNMLDQANDRTKLTTDLGKKADAVLAGVQDLICWMERPEPEQGDDGHDTLDWESR